MSVNLSRIRTLHDSTLRLQRPATLGGTTCIKNAAFRVLYKAPAKFGAMHLQARRISAPLNSSILFTMRTRIITTAGIAFCSLFPAIATLGDTVIVPAPRATVITEVPAPPTVNTVVRALDSSRYQLIEKKDNKEIYRDTQTGEKWILEIHHQNG